MSKPGYRTGQKVAYAGSGAGFIDGRENKEYGGIRTTYIVFHSADGTVTRRAPIANTENIRPLLSITKLNEALEQLLKPRRVKRKVRLKKQELKQILHSNDLAEICRLAADTNIFLPGVGINEREACEIAIKIIASEVMYVKDMSPVKARELVEHQLKQAVENSFT